MLIGVVGGGGHQVNAIGGILQCQVQQLVVALVLFEKAHTRDIVADVQRSCGVRVNDEGQAVAGTDLATAAFVILIHECGVRGKAVVDIPQQAEAGLLDPAVVGVALAAQVVGRTVRIGLEGFGAGHAGLVHQEGLVYKTGAMLVGQHGTECQGVFNERYVNNRIRVVTGVAALGHVIGTGAAVNRKFAAVGGIRNVAQGATERAAAVQRALRTALHFNPVNVHRNQIQIDRRFAEIGTDTIALRVAQQFRRVNGAGIDAAHDQTVGLARALIHLVQTRRPASQIGQVANLQALEIGLVQCSDAVGDILHGGVTPGCSNQQLIGVADGAGFGSHPAAAKGAKRHRYSGSHGFNACGYSPNPVLFRLHCLVPQAFTFHWRPCLWQSQCAVSSPMCNAHAKQFDT